MLTLCPFSIPQLHFILSPKEVHEDQLKKKTKRENEKDGESKKSFILLAHKKNKCAFKVYFFLPFSITKGFYLFTIFVKEF